MVNFLKHEIKQITGVKGGCFASNRITVDGEKVGYAYREKPGSNFPNDSGWRFLHGDENDKYLNSPENFNVYELNTICNYDEDILPYLEEPVGTVLVRKNDRLVIEKE